MAAVIAAAPISHAATISVVANGTQSQQIQYTVPGAGRYSLRAKSQASGTAVVNNGAESCLTVTGWTTRGTSFSGWAYSENWTAGESFSISMTLENTCNVQYGPYVGFFNLSNTAQFVGAWFTIPARQTCGVTINNLALGNINKGDSKRASLPVAFTGYTGSYLTFNSSHMLSDGSLTLGGDSAFVVKPTTTANIITSQTNPRWRINYIASGSIPLMVSAGMNATSGEHTSVLTATLNCN